MLLRLLRRAERIRREDDFKAGRGSWVRKANCDYFADICVFNAETVAEKGTFAEPTQLPMGIEHVLVNGQPVFEGGKGRGSRAGRMLRSPGRQSAFKG